MFVVHWVGPKSESAQRGLAEKCHDGPIRPSGEHPSTGRPLNTGGGLSRTSSARGSGGQREMGGDTRASGHRGHDCAPYCSQNRWTHLTR